MYKVIEHVIKINKRNIASTGVIIINPDEPPYFIKITTYSDYIKFIRAQSANTARYFTREFANVFFITENITHNARYFECGKELSIPNIYY